MPSSSSASRRRSSGRRGAQAARQALYRTLILDAAEALWAEKGFEATKMEEIAEESGLALGTVYAVFRGKSAIPLPSTSLAPFSWGRR